jgi:hypothetical protein
MSDADPPLPRAAVLALAVLTVVVVGVLGLALFWGDIVADTSPSTATAGTTVVDDFERPDADGLADDEHPWEEPTGQWIVQDGHAALAELGDTHALAVLPTDEPAAVEVTARAVEPGWGLAFRIQDPTNLWAVVARPERGTWSLVHLEEGVPDEVQDFVTSEPRDGSVVRVELAGDRLRVTVDGRVNERVDPALIDATGVGLLALPGGSVPSMAWDDLTVTAS